MIRLFTKTRRRKTRDGFSPSPLIRELDAAGYVRVTDAVTADQPSEITQAQFQGLVSGAGTVGPSYTWANALAAGLAGEFEVGDIIRVSNAWVHAGGSMWMWDGTNLRTLTGRQVVSAGRTGTPGAGIVTATGIGKMALPDGLGMISGGSIAFPLGMLRVGTGLEVRAMMRHTGTAGTWSVPWRFGTSNTAADTGIVQNSGAAANDSSQWSFMECHFPDATSYVTGFNLIANGASGTSSLAARPTNVNLALPMFLGLYASSFTAPDTVELMSYSVTFLD